MKSALTLLCLLPMVACGGSGGGTGTESSCSLTIDGKGTFDCSYTPGDSNTGVSFQSENSGDALDLTLMFPQGIDTWHCQDNCAASVSYQDGVDYPSAPQPFLDLCYPPNSGSDGFGDCSIGVTEQNDTDIALSFSATLWNAPPSDPSALSVTVSGSGHAHRAP